MASSTSQSRELSGEALPAAKPRRGVRRAIKTAEGRGRIARRGGEIAADPASAHERAMTAGLRLSIGAAMGGMTLFFHAPLGAALSALFR